jgi:hypothetical protein
MQMGSSSEGSILRKPREIKKPEENKSDGQMAFVPQLSSTARKRPGLEAPTYKH